MPNLYIIAGPNGAGKTTAAFTVLPEMLACREFVNADGIARGLSPFNVEGVATHASRIMLDRISDLLKERQDLGIETTLATRKHLALIKEAQSRGYCVSLLFLWLSTPLLAAERVQRRTGESGNGISADVIQQRWQRGLRYLMHDYIPVVDNWIVYDHSIPEQEKIAAGGLEARIRIFNPKKWQLLHNLAYGTR